MITHAQIKELPRKYAIGKRPLSRILGWGELTYTRLLEGSMPSPQHEEELLRALNEPLAYLMLLNQAHDAGVISDLSFERSRKAASEYVQQDDSADDTLKMHSVAKKVCVAAKGDITPHALQLLVFFTQASAQSAIGSQLFDQQPSMTDGGPEYADLAVWFTFDRIQETATSAPSDSDLGLTAEEAALAEGIVERYGIYSAQKLQEMAADAIQGVKGGIKPQVKAKEVTAVAEPQPKPKVESQSELQPQVDAVKQPVEKLVEQPKLKAESQVQVADQRPVATSMAQLQEQLAQAKKPKPEPAAMVIPPASAMPSAESLKSINQVGFLFEKAKKKEEKKAKKKDEKKSKKKDEKKTKKSKK